MFPFFRKMASSFLGGSVTEWLGRWTCNVVVAVGTSNLRDGGTGGLEGQFFRKNGDFISKRGASSFPSLQVTSQPPPPPPQTWKNVPPSLTLLLTGFDLGCPSSTPLLRFVYSRLVCLLPVGSFNHFMFI